MEATYMSISRWMDKKAVVHIHNGILLIWISSNEVDVNLVPCLTIVKHVLGLSQSVMSNSLWPYELQPTRLLCPWDSPGKNTGEGCHFLLQEIFPSQRSNPRLLYWQVDSLPLSHLGSPTLWDELLLLSSICRWGNRDSEKYRNLTKISQQERVEPGFKVK